MQIGEFWLRWKGGKGERRRGAPMFHSQHLFFKAALSSALSKISARKIWQRFVENKNIAANFQWRLETTRWCLLWGCLWLPHARTHFLSSGMLCSTIKTPVKEWHLFNHILNCICLLLPPHPSSPLLILFFWNRENKTNNFFKFTKRKL